ncbi:putative Cyclic nucleotide-binding protein [Candidatus Sulfotelmatomonas gaucii]|uniref:Putative Cyclic nucleotide-binding protein n=1 Tax=Candidatus Sulfuritelmatomonas gaucii TaxID=2043161 RepID=A0A2N9M9I3_9BACT|nr:putative Cyclic nucleotide-binding protein [Candidatus Sulfotelmatomonas gaucii]
MQNSFVADITLIQALEQRSVSVPCMRGHLLFKQGEAPIGLYLLKSGKASMVMTAEDGEEVLHLTVGPGSILGVPAVVGRDFYTLSAMAGPGAEVGFIAQEDFEDLIQSEPSLFPKVLEVLAAEVRSARLALSGLLRKLSKRQA